ncbi:MAG: HU family DNA-binding protein [Opitutales bacterium]|nr:HU family DNA-binding protein [Opitutales bacterium]
MNKTELIEEVQKGLGKEATKACADCALTSVLKAIMHGVKKEGKVQLIGFGTFSIVKRGPRNGVNPQTGKAIKIAASKTVKFKPGAAFKEML